MTKKYGIQIKGLGRALRPSGLGVLRPKPTGKGGKPLKPKPIGKKDGGKVYDKRKPKKPLKGQMKKPKPGTYDYQLQETMKPDYKKRKAMKKGGFPDLTGDGKVTRADVLKGRGVFASGGRPGLYANIHAKRRRGGKMKKKGAKGAPTARRLL